MGLGALWTDKTNFFPSGPFRCYRLGGTEGLGAEVPEQKIIILSERLTFGA